MKRLLLSLLVAGTFLTAVYAQGSSHRHHRKGYFFLPPRNVFYYYQPYRGPAPSRGGYGSYLPPRAARYYPQEACCYGDSGHLPGFTGNYAPTAYRIYVQSPPGEVVRSNSSDLIFKVDPPQALIYVDGKLIGGARDFATERDRYMLLDGEHDLRIECLGYRPFVTKMDIVPNKTLHLDIELEEIEEER